MITYPTNKLQKVLLAGKCRQGVLPDGYTQVEYLQSSGTQYIDTGAPYKSSRIYHIDFQYVEYPSGAKGVLGARQTTTAGEGTFDIGCNSTVFYFYNNATHAHRRDPRDLARHTVEIDYTNSVIKFDGETLTWSGGTDAWQGTYNIYIGRENMAGSPNPDVGTVKWYPYKVYDNGALFQNLIPARRNSDNVLGMYDTVTGNFLTNAGTGEFIAGADVVVYTGDNTFKGHTEKVNGQLVNDDTYNWVRDTNNNLIFPDGMKSAGSVYDEIVYEDGTLKAIKRIGSFNLGNAQWSYNKAKQFRTTSITNYKKYPPNSIHNISIAKDYTLVSSASFFLDYTAGDKTIALYDSGSLLGIKDTSYNGDISAFKQAMSGVMLYYELATPVEYTLSNVKGILPTPDEPIDIVCNNGVVKYGAIGKNLYNVATKINGYYLTSIGSTVADEIFCYSALIPVKPNTTYVLSGINYIAKSYKRLHAYDSDGNWLEQLNFAYVEGVKTNFMVVGTTTAQTAYIRISIARADANIQVEEGVNATSYKPYQAGIYTDGTQEVVTDSLGNTANAEMLLGVGDYKDVQSVLDGKVTRNVGVKVLDGTEVWDKGTSFYTHALDAVMDALQATHTVFCTHYQGVSTDTNGVGDSNTCKIGSNVSETPNWGRICIYADRSLYATGQDFANYLAQQYANGTPVIIVYPLATPTTEQVTPQPLAGSSATVTAGSIDNLLIESSTIAELKKRYIGDREVKRVYIGENLVWEND